MSKNARHTITIKDLRKLIREELIREIQEPVDLALVGDVDDLPTDMVTELPRPNHARLRALSEQDRRHATRKQLNESFKSAAISLATGINSDAIERLMPLFSKEPTTPEVAVEIAKKVVSIDYGGDANSLIKDVRGALRRADAVAPVLAKFVIEGYTLRLTPVTAAIRAIESATGQNLSDILTGIKAMSKRLTGKEGF